MRTWRRVAWHDATSTRPGWRCYYATAGVSLRGMPSPRWSAAAGCWVASTVPTAAEAATESAVSGVAVAGAMRKLLARGSAAPLVPAAEARLLALLDTGDPRPPQLGDFYSPPGSAGSYDMSLVESPAEKALVEWAMRHYPTAVGWLVPQPPLDVLAAAGGQGESVPAEIAGRRCDFLLKVPGKAPIVVEVDGSQHAEQHSVDDQRDRLLEAGGVTVIRVAAAEAFAGAGTQLDALSEMLVERSTQQAGGSARLVWAAVQTHRLVLGLCEALATGMFTGRRWLVRLHDPTGMAARLVGPYLGLFDALDVMWGDRSTAPEEVIFTTDSGAVGWRRESLCNYTEFLSPAVNSSAAGGWVEIRLEPAVGSACVLPDTDGSPMVVVRSSLLPMPVNDHIDALPARQPAFANADTDEAAEAVATAMRAVFAVEEPREGQSEAIIEVLSGRDCVVLLPTGAGKSMIYQLAGLCMPGRTLIVDPLVSLIEDQVESLKRHGIDRAAGITAANTRPDALDGAYFVFVSPERLQRQAFRDELTEHSKTLPVNLAVVDEAHCVSEWGHDFRTAYLDFGALLRRVCDGALGPPPLLALTGTASRAVLKDVLVQLDITPASDNTLIRPTSFDRPELSFEVVRAAPNAAAAALRGELRAMPARFGVPAASFYSAAAGDTYCGIVFTTTVRGRDRGLDPTIEEVRQVAPDAVRYAGRPPKGVSAEDWQLEKANSARAFKGNQAPVMVATKAFGMGIDKPNVRWILHYGMPSSIEGYYQEAGRAGRDRRAAHCVLLLIDNDAQRNRRLLADDASVRASGSARDDIGTSLWFHALAFPDDAKERSRIVETYAQLAAGDTTIPLGEDDSTADERTLHRLAVLGIVDGYTLSGARRTLSAAVTLASPTPQQIAENLLTFVERNQPGRAASTREQLQLPHRSTTEAVERCSSALVGFVRDVVGRSRRRSLREMWLIASAAADRRGQDGGETVRARVLEYLTEGDVAALLVDLAERERFAYSDWTPSWEQIASDADVREWRAAAARLLVSYPDHPGLLATRAIAEMLLSDGDLTDAEINLRRSYQQAADAYAATPDDITVVANWTLAHLVGHSPQPAAPISNLAAGVKPLDAAAAIAVSAALAVPAVAGHAQEWLSQHWQHSEALAAVHLTTSLEAVTVAVDEALARYSPTTRSSP